MRSSVLSPRDHHVAAIQFDPDARPGEYALARLALDVGFLDDPGFKRRLTAHGLPTG